MERTEIAAFGFNRLEFSGNEMHAAAPRMAGVTFARSKCCAGQSDRAGVHGRCAIAGIRVWQRPAGAGLKEERRDAPVFAPGTFPRLPSVRRRIVPSAPDAYRPCPGDGRDNGSVTQRHCVAASGLRSGRPSPKPEAPYATSREKKAVPAYLVLFIDARSCVKFLVGRMPAESTAKVVRTYAPSGMGVCFIFDRRE